MIYALISVILYRLILNKEILIINITTEFK